MKKLVIILAVFVLLFVAVLVWGVARDRDPPPDGEDQALSCNGLPKKVDGSVDTDRMGDWKERCAPTGAEKSANRYTKGTLLAPAEISLIGNLNEDTRELDAIGDEDKIRVVKLARTSGGPIEATATIKGDDGDEEQQLCLCAEGERLTNKDGARICEKALDKRAICPTGDDNLSGTFAFGYRGGSIVFRSHLRAEARSRK